MPYEPTKRPELEAKSAAELLIIYLNWQNRLIPPRRRNVHRSQAIEHNPLATARKLDLDQIAAKIVNGDVLTPHLSTLVNSAYESPTRGRYGRRNDLDLMLAEWQVHHLHVSNTLRPDGFVVRDGPLLFVAFGLDDAYLIDIFEHGDWTKEAIAHVLIDEWPDCGLVHEAKGIVGLERHVSETERATLRGAGISAPFIERNGKFYMLGLGGITSSGTSIVATRQANYIIAAARMFAEHIASNPEYISETLRANGLEPPREPDLHLAFMPHGSCRIIERQAKALFPLPPP